RNMPLPQRTFYPKTPLIAKLQELVWTSHEPFRFVGIHAQFFPNLSGVYGIEDIRAHDPMSNARYLAFLKLTADYEPWNYFAFLNDPNKSVFDFLNVRYVALVPAAAAPDPARYALLYDGPDGKIVENRTVLPRFYSVRSVLPVFYPHIRAHRDWANTAFADDTNFHGAATTKITSASATEYRLHASAAQRSLVVSSIPFWPGWNVAINGKRVKPMKVNAVFLGFAVPPGQSDVRVWYSPLSFRVGVWVSLGTVLMLVLLYLNFLFRRSRATLSTRARTLDNASRCLVTN
ncbi:MAG: YfhO family protein, partial [Thermoanaerobaculia bacterium]